MPDRWACCSFEGIGLFCHAVDGWLAVTGPRRRGVCAVSPPSHHSGHNAAIMKALNRTDKITCGEAGMTEWILTLIGPDRPGLIEVVAERVVASGGNWMVSRMAQLGGKFAGIAHVAVPADQIDDLKQQLAALESDGLVVHVESAASAAIDPEVVAVAADQTESAEQFLLQVIGGDRPGIVRELSGVLAASGINVESLATEYTAAPMSGGPLFRAEVQFALPAAVTLDQLRAEVEAVAGDLMVDFSPISPLQP